MKKLGWPNENRLKIINKALLVSILAINGYVVFLPLLPKVDYAVKQHVTKPVKISADDGFKNIDRSRNHLILPTIQLDEPMLVSDNPSTVHRGIWHRPATNLPDQLGNTVLVGHRFTYAGAAVFYNLDKLQVNDDVYLVYNQKIYHYIVNVSEIVPPSATEVEAPSEIAELTIYTCTPLWTAKDRLVYVAKLKEVL